MGKNYDQLDIDEHYEIYRLHQTHHGDAPRTRCAHKPSC